ncbi:MCE family protein [Stappia sp. F7233]|uniref:MCE family protein n=1 Tax=Stappia albiluteola TaxID=2758565 RepID=A0A839AD73_9HYPH|nr:MlaD family protein [Stappia albiluteola]MBA5777720.1 MCE family protein [Stappia albiluteola]
METRANYVAIGAFVFVVIFAAFTFIFWLGSTADRTKNVNVKIIFPGAVTGLSQGSQVVFNGIKIGDVGALNFDPEDPKVVVATVRIDPTAPLRKDVKATLGYQGLTGVAYVELFGGTNQAASLFEGLNGAEPVIYADRSAFEDIVQGARNILGEADQTLKTIEEVIAGNRDEIDQTIKNIKVFSDALAANSDGVQTFMSSMSTTGEALTKLSGRLESLVVKAERIVDAVPPEKVTETINSAAAIGKSLEGAAGQVAGLIDEAKAATDDLKTFTEGLNKNLNDIDQVIAAVEPEKVKQVVDGAASFAKLLQDRSGDLNEIVTKSTDVINNIQTITQTIESREEEISTFLTEAVDASKKVNTFLDGANKVVAALEPDRIGNIMANVEGFTSTVLGKSDTVGKAIDDVSAGAASFRALTDDLDRKRPELDTIIKNATEISQNLNAASVRVTSVIDKVDGMVEGDGGGLVAQLTATAESIRKVADSLDKNIGPIADGLNRFTSRGSADFSAAMAQLNRTLVEIQRAVANIDRNPSRVIFGGSDLPTYDGAKRR